MNAINPVPSPASGAEPSMEEILASIRRIIADDQPLPGAAVPEVPSETAKAKAQPVRPPAIEPPLDSMPAAQGLIASPQFPTPEGPARVMDTPHPLAPTPEPAAIVEPAPAPTSDHAVALQRDAHEEALRVMHEEPDARAAAVTAAHDHVYEGQFFEEAIEEEPFDEVPAPEAPRPQPAAEEPMRANGKAPEDQPAAGLFSAATSQSLASAFNTLAISRLADDSEQLRGLARDMLRPLLKDWLDANLPGLVESIIREEIDRMARRTR